MIAAASLSILISGALLALLGVRDPKRLRNSAQRLTAVTLPARIRRACGWLVLVPGVVLAALGQWWAFLIWLGVITALGWLTAYVLASDH